MKNLLVLLSLLFTYSLGFAQHQNVSIYKFQNNFGEFFSGNTQPITSLASDEELKSLLSNKFLTNPTITSSSFISVIQSPKTRGVKDAALFKSISPSVVLIVSDDSLGSGSLISDKGEILTNLHVVGNNQEVGVIYKPTLDTQKISKNDIYRAKVVKFDQVTDLALIRVISFPKDRQPLKLGGSFDISVGSDVHAIGHPRGESWTYTKGVISQYRNDYQWTSGDADIKHQADVIQTQTPINPGNSGGPLISDSGKLIGVNTFKAGDSEGLNFAVSVDDVRNFLARKEDRSVSIDEKIKPISCEWRKVYEGKTNDKSGDVIAYDTQCSGKTDLEVVNPYDKSKPYFLRADRNLDGKIDLLVLSYTRDEKWSFSYWDNNFDGKWDAVGFHPNGELKPTRYEDYKNYLLRIAKK